VDVNQSVGPIFHRLEPFVFRFSLVHLEISADLIDGAVDPVAQDKIGQQLANFKGRNPKFFCQEIKFYELVGQDLFLKDVEADAAEEVALVLDELGVLEDDVVLVLHDLLNPFDIVLLEGLP